VICGTGSLRLALEWHLDVQLQSVVWDIDSNDPIPRADCQQSLLDSPSRVRSPSGPGRPHDAAAVFGSA